MYDTLYYKFSWANPMMYEKLYQTFTMREIHQLARQLDHKIQLQAK